MSKFYLTVFITMAAVTLFVLFTALKNELERRRKTKMAIRSWQKLYTDEEQFIRSRFRVMLSELTSGNIHWIIFQSRLAPSARFEITISTLNKRITIIYSARDLSDFEEKYLLNLGADGYEKKDVHNEIHCEPNSKIICDVIFYLMDTIFGIKYIKKINLNVSGGI